MAKLRLEREEARLLPSTTELSVEELLQKFVHADEATLSLQPHVQVSSFELPVWTLWQWAISCQQSNATVNECDVAEAEQSCARLPIQEYQESLMSYRCEGTVRTVKIWRDGEFFKSAASGEAIGPDRRRVWSWAS